MSRSTTAACLFAASLLALPCAVRAADCNHNGADDIADLASGASRDCNANLVPDECELAAGAIAYEARLTFHTGFATSIVAEDFDGDADLDMVATEFYAPGQDQSLQQDRAVVFLRNLGGGTFGPPERYSVGEKPSSVQAEDLDGDSDLDLLVVFSPAAQLGIYINRSDGTFEGPELHAVTGTYVGSDRSGSSFADLDGDGDRDIALVALEPNQVAFFINQGDGSFTAGTSLLIEAIYGKALEDLDGDGDVDIILHTNSEPDSFDSFFSVLLNDGTGAFPDRADYDLGAYPGAIALADLDADGDLDYLVARDPPQGSGLPQDVAVFRNRGDGRFDPAPSLPSSFTTELIQVADLDLDGDVDILLASDGQISPGCDSVTIFLNDGTGAFSSPVRHIVGDHPTQVEVVDVNGDGRPEVLALNYFGGSLSVLRNVGGGVFDEPVDFPIIGGGGPRMACGDLDADGYVDVATVSFSNDQSIGILQNISGGEFLQGCREFLRGDVNTDGAVSLSDIIMFRRWLLDGGTIPACFDAADASDNDDLGLCDALAILNVLFRNPGWSQSLAEPSFVPGSDPTPFGVATPHSCDNPEDGRPALPLGCGAYEIEPPRASTDMLTIGDATAIPGASVQLPIFLSTTLEIDAVQLVISYDPSVLEVDAENVLGFESTYFDLFDTKPFGLVSVDVENGLLVAGIAGDLIRSGHEIAPGNDTLIAYLRLRVRDDAISQRVPIELSNGPGDAGVGPYHLKNELTHRGEARFASFLPQRHGAILGIVGDQTLFVRGDANGDQKLDISDPVRTLGALFLDSGRLACEDAADANDDGLLNISDPIFALETLFQGGRPVPQPFPGVGMDPTADELFCIPVPAGR